MTDNSPQATKQVPDEAGRFGDFGGRYVPETLTRALDELAAEYPQRLRAHVASLKKLTVGMGGHYLQVDTDQPLDRTLAGYLRFRARHH